MTDKSMYEVDYQRVAHDIRKLKPAGRTAFLAGVIIAGLMYLPLNIQRPIELLKSSNLHLDNFEILAVFFNNNPALAEDMLHQAADYAQQGVFPEDDGQSGWNQKEFDVATNLLMLTLK